MKTKISTILFVLFAGVIFSHKTWAQDLGVTVGVTQDSADTATILGNNQPNTGMYVGGLGILPFSQRFALRSGFVYSKHNFKFSLNGVDTNYSFTNFDVPATLMFRISDTGGVFAGPLLRFNLSSTCDQAGSSCSVGSPQSTLIPFTVGASFKMAPQIGMEVYYETSSSSLATYVNNPRAMGVSLLIFFE